MSHHPPSRWRRPRFTALLSTVATAFALALVAGCGDDDESVAVADNAVAAEHHKGAPSPAIHTEAGHELQDAMRALWQDHGYLTVRAIVAAVNELPETDAVVARLLDNQTEIGDSIKPY